MPINEMATAVNSRANLGLWAIVPDNWTTPPAHHIEKSQLKKLFVAYLYKVAPT